MRNDGDADFVLNRRADVGRPYSDRERAVLSHARAGEARREIATWPGYAVTPLHSLPGLARRLGVGTVLYKDEGSRFGLGSFKALGGAYGVLRAVGRDAGKNVVVTTATDGNHGRAVAWGAQRLGLQSVIYLPRDVSPAREGAIRALGARIVHTGENYDDTVRQCAADAVITGRTVIADTSWSGYEAVPGDVMQGYTVLAAELLDQIGEGERPTHLFLQAGVGGLAAAVVAHLWEASIGQRPVAVIVEPRSADCLYQTARAGRLTTASGDVRSIMAGLCCGEVSPLAWKILEHGADAFMRIDDAQAVDAMRVLAQGIDGDPSIVAGESAAAGVAGAFALVNQPAARAAVGLDLGARVLFVGTEGATDWESYERLVNGASSTAPR